MRYLLFLSLYSMTLMCLQMSTGEAKRRKISAQTTHLILRLQQIVLLILLVAISR